MTTPEAFLQLGITLIGTFVGAFLAFWLDKRREHKQLGKIANIHLKRLYLQIADLPTSQEATMNDLKKTVKAYAKLHQASDEAATDDIDWDELTQLFYGTEDDLSYLLKTEITQVLPLDFIEVLSALEGAMKIHGLQRSLVNQVHQNYIFPLVLNPHLPLTPSERSAVAYCLVNIDKLVKVKEILIEKSKETKALLDKHNLDR